MKNHRSPIENYENQEKLRTPYETFKNHEQNWKQIWETQNHKNLRNPTKNHKIMKILEFHMRIIKIIKIVEIQCESLKSWKT